MLLGRQLRQVYGSEFPYIVLASLIANSLSLALPLIFIQIYDRVIPAQNYATLAILALGLVTAAIVELFVRTARARMMSVAGASYEQNMMRTAFARLFSADLRAFNDEPTGRHIDRINAIDKIREFRSGESATAFLDLPFALLFLGFIAWIAPLIAGALVALIVAAAACSWLVSRRARALDEKRSELEGRRHSFLIEVLDGMDSIKSLGIGPFMMRRYERMKGTSAQYSRDVIATSHLAQGIVAVFSQAAPVVAGCAGAVLFINNELTVGALAAVTLMAGRIVSPVLRLESLVVGNQNTRLQQEQVASILAMPQHDSGTSTIGPIEAVDFANVGYTNENNSKAVLDNVNLSIRTGEIVGICGPAGSGKSVLLSLLAGDLKPSTGRISINRVDMADLDYWTLRDQIAYLPRKHTLLDGTLIENLTRFDKARYNEEAMEISRAFGLDEYFARHQNGLSAKIQAGLESGLPTAVLESVALVAELLGRPRLILFDEANESLDQMTDQRLLKYLESRRSDTAILIASNHSRYQAICDRVFKVVDGELVEQPKRPTLPFYQTSGGAVGRIGRTR